jgi:KipI family sensor histidine kinase inhibitor
MGSEQIITAVPFVGPVKLILSRALHLFPAHFPAHFLCDFRRVPTCASIATSAAPRLRDTVGMHARRVGRHALLVECADLDAVGATYVTLCEHAAELGAVEIVPAARTVLLDGLRDPQATAGVLRGLSPATVAATAADADLVEIPTSYDGPDLGEVARQWAVSEAEVVRIHTSTEFVVAFCGFAPGFAYCTGLPADRAVSRRPEPRPRVPVGAVAVAGEFTSVYPTASPGGWQLIGSTTTEVWRPDDERPALLAPGTRVRFRDA